jgi:chromosome partitioning protein
MGVKPAALAIKHTKFGVDMLAANGLLAAIEQALEPGDEIKLSDFLRPLKPSYGFILIDTPPGKAQLAFNGLAAADLIVITASAERMAVDGVADLINHVQRSCGISSRLSIRSFVSCSQCTGQRPLTHRQLSRTRRRFGERTSCQ